MPDPTPNPFQDRLARITRLRERLATLEGHAESPDGLIKVTCTTEDPLHDLQLHPRALKLLNTNLSSTIQQTATEAGADLKRHTDEVLATLFGPDDPARLLTDPTAAKARLQDLTETVKTAGTDTTAAFERLRQLLGH
jgi:DNA-binding protein YbaB